jgi:uncharacterized repeat protein (TIGR04052 family)
MRFTERYWRAHAPMFGLAMLCMTVSGSSACDDEAEPASTQQDEQSSSAPGDSDSISSRTRRGSSSSSTKKKTVAACKESCDEEGDSCKQDCDDDDEDCNKSCDDDRYACRKRCDKTSGTSSSSSDSDDAADASKKSSDKSEKTSEPSGDEMAVTIKFAARVGKEDFACGQEYKDVGSKKTTVTPTDLRMFVQDVKLISASGKEVDVALDVRKPWQSKDVALLDFEDGSGECGEGNTETNTKITGKVPQDTYVGIVFTNGVPEALNHADPTAEDDPIGMFAGLSWGWLGGFRFTKVELRQVSSGADFGSAVAHLGSTACTGKPQTGTVKCGKPNRNHVQLDEFNPKSDTIIFDVASVFEHTDLTQMAECHSTGDFCAPMFEAFGVDLGTGKALDKQAVFSVM